MVTAIGQVWSWMNLPFCRTRDPNPVPVDKYGTPACLVGHAAPIISLVCQYGFDRDKPLKE
jgi:hypothetical protein